MDIDFPLFDNAHLLGDCAMRPIAPRLTILAALLLIGYFRALLRLALPGPPLAAHSGASNCCF